MTFDPTSRKVSTLRQKYNDMSTESRGRFKELVMIACDISPTTFYEWIDNPQQITKPDRYYIARLLDQDPREIFKTDNP